MNLENIETYGVKYIGSKKKILPAIGKYLEEAELLSTIKSAIDVFTGTTRVAQYFKQLGIKTYTADLSWASTCYANTFIHNKDRTSNFEDTIENMNKLSPIDGWLTQNYSGNVPIGEKRGEGRCWQSKNTKKADAARDYIETLDIEDWQKDVLITSIIFALDKVDNTVGVQQAYLKEWCTRSYNDIVFQLPPCIEGPIAKHFCGNVLNINFPPCDLAYLDPPYSPHSYSSYYHIWDSIAKWDKPETSLTARRRNDRVARHSSYNSSLESDWNFPDRALDAFDKLIKRLPVRYVLISYNDESIINKDKLQEICNKHGKPSMCSVEYSRNIMSQIGNAARHNPNPEKKQKNKELLILIEKSA